MTNKRASPPRHGSFTKRSQDGASISNRRQQRATPKSPGKRETSKRGGAYVGTGPEIVSGLSRMVIPFGLVLAKKGMDAYKEDHESDYQKEKKKGGASPQVDASSSRANPLKITTAGGSSSPPKPNPKKCSGGKMSEEFADLVEKVSRQTGGRGGGNGGNPGLMGMGVLGAGNNERKKKMDSGSEKGKKGKDDGKGGLLGMGWLGASDQEKKRNKGKNSGKKGTRGSPHKK